MTNRINLSGFAASFLIGLVYFILFRADGSLFYFFALPYFLVGPLIAGIITAHNPGKHKILAPIVSAGEVFGFALLIFIFTYAISIIFFIPTINLPAYCDGTYQGAGIPQSFKYILPEGDVGLIVIEDETTLVAAKIDYVEQPHPAKVFLIDKSNQTILWSADLPNDNIAAALDNDSAYVFYEGLGDLLDKRTGKYIDRLVTMDNYGTNTDQKFQTTGIMSIWYKNGAVKPFAHLKFNGIIQGCHINGETKTITQL